MASRANIPIRRLQPVARLALEASLVERLKTFHGQGSGHVAPLSEALGSCIVKSTGGFTNLGSMDSEVPKAPVVPVGRTELKKMLYVSSQTGSRVELVEM